MINMFTNRYYSILENELYSMMVKLNLTVGELSERVLAKSYVGSSNIDYFVDNEIALSVIHKEIKGGTGNDKCITIPVDFIRHYEKG